MKKFLAIFALGILSVFAHAEATFDQIEGLIQQKNYAAAEAGLEVIVKNHPQSAKAFYAMAQAQAGLGNLDKAQKALNIATGLNPTLDFAPEGSVRKLKEAITPQTAKIEQIEESHTTRNVMIVLLLVVTGFAGWYGYKEIQRKREEEEAERKAELDRVLREQTAKEAAARATTRAKASATKEAKTDTPAPTACIATSGPAVPQPMYTPQPAVQPTHTTTVVNNGSNNDLLTTMVVMDMLSDHHHHHDTTRVVEREVIREVPAPSRDSSWDTPSTSSSSSSSRSSSWDDDSSSRSSSRSSSWDSDSSSSSSSSSSWSSSSSDSSSSWSSSDSSSSSSWD